ncbi:hypothetical protein ABZT04_00850 [Streptomyces sp. NPDC005492]|uniref:hypothetical protein n=1 Tax=Streptomyces sp. NPDC005492 TaxID=3156883 RepID=UPI0033BF5C57
MTQAAPHLPAQLPSNFDAWLLDCAPVRNCDVCTANWHQLTACKQSGDITRATRHATEIRDHASGVHAGPQGK